MVDLIEDEIYSKVFDCISASRESFQKDPQIGTDQLKTTLEQLLSTERLKARVVKEQDSNDDSIVSDFTHKQKRVAESTKAEDQNECLADSEMQPSRSLNCSPILSTKEKYSPSFVIYSSVLGRKLKKNEHQPYIKMEDFEIVEKPGMGVTHMPHYQYHPSTYAMGQKNKDDRNEGEERWEDLEVLEAGYASDTANGVQEVRVQEKGMINRIEKSAFNTMRKGVYKGFVFRRKCRRKCAFAENYNTLTPKGFNGCFRSAASGQEIASSCSCHNYTHDNNRLTYPFSTSNSSPQFVSDTILHELIFAIQHLSLDIRQLRSTMSHFSTKVDSLSRVMDECSKCDILT